MLLLKTDIKSDIWIQKSSFPNTDRHCFSSYFRMHIDNFRLKFDNNKTKYKTPHYQEVVSVMAD